MIKPIPLTQYADQKPVLHTRLLEFKSTYKQFVSNLKKRRNQLKYQPVNK